MSALMAIHRGLWLSFRRLPLWAHVLLPANLLSLFLLQYPGARMVAIAAVLVLGSNMLLMYGCAGFTRLMALPDLLVWRPLQVMLLIAHCR